MCCGGTQSDTYFTVFSILIIVFTIIILIIIILTTCPEVFLAFVWFQGSGVQRHIYDCPHASAHGLTAHTSYPKCLNDLNAKEYIVQAAVAQDGMALEYASAR